MTAHKTDWREVGCFAWLAVVLVPSRPDRGENLATLEPAVQAAGAIAGHGAVRRIERIHDAALSIFRLTRTTGDVTPVQFRAPGSACKMKAFNRNRRVVHTIDYDEFQRAAASERAEERNRAWLRIGWLWVSIGILVAGLIQGLAVFTQ